MKDDYATVPILISSVIHFSLNVGRMYFLSSRVKGLSSHNKLSHNFTYFTSLLFTLRQEGINGNSEEFVSFTVFHSDVLHSFISLACCASGWLVSSNFIWIIRRILKLDGSNRDKTNTTNSLLFTWPILEVERFFYFCGGRDGDSLDLFTWPFRDILGRLTRSTAHCHRRR